MIWTTYIPEITRPVSKKAKGRIQQTKAMRRKKNRK